MLDHHSDKASLDEVPHEHVPITYKEEGDGGRLSSVSHTLEVTKERINLMTNEGEEVIKDISLNLWRPPTDNDRNG